ncbi:MAG: PKD domain-containing protein [Candidatus Cloacimonetes bacterium]|nr:PKD domain-containing protein [Candidatus Cloacimonadota bacterium]
MKKLLILLGLSLLLCSLVAEDFMQPAQVAKGNYNPAMRFGMRNVSRDQNPAPEYAFIPNGDGENTTYLTSSYYDYMPFSYNGYNLRKQPEIAQPLGYPADGWYVSYMRSETQAVGSDRRAYYSYINPDGTLAESNSINPVPNREGFTSLAIDPYTSDPFEVWHAVTEPDGTYDSHMSYSIFHITGTPGAWRSPFIIMDNPEMSAPLTGHYDDEFIWPLVWIGPSPIANHRRVHAYGNNYTNTNYNCLYLYADFDDTDLLMTSDLNWTINTIPYFDYMAYNDIGRINKDMIVCEDDGQVIFVGSVTDSLFAMYSDDYGETFTRYTQQLKQPMANPTNYQTGEYLWINDDGTPAEMYIVPTNDLTHFNGVFTDNNTKVQWMTGVTYNSQENIDDGSYWPAYIYPKIFTFDTVTHEFSFYDIDVQDSDPGDDHLAVAFDLDDDGVVDEYDVFGWPIVVMSAPSWFFDGDYQDAYFNESNCKMVANGDWLVTAWHDGAKLQNAYHGVEGYDGWVEQSEIAIIISSDAGETWSDIRYINSNPNDNVIDPANHYDGNYAPEFENMLPVNISLGDKLEILSNVPGNYHAKLNFVFMSDSDYGSAVQGHGGWTNSPLMYAAIDLNFGIPLTAEFIADILSGDPPLTVNFTDLSTGSTPTSWEWDFDNDGSIDSYEQNPTHIYTEIGFYTVSLTASDGTNTDTETKVDYITVGDPVIADFVADPLIGLLPLTVNFTDLSTGSTAISWEWDFDNDGTIDSYEQNPTHIYSEEGMYTVSLTASDGSYSDTEIKIDYITVGEPIIADFEANPLIGLAPLSVQFTDLSSGGLDILLNMEKKANISPKTNNKKIYNTESSREVVSWEWDFNNDGTIDSYEQNPTHNYTEEGMYTVVLTVSDGTNTDTETKVDYITVGEPIIADFEADPLIGISPLDVQFTDLSSGGLDSTFNRDDNASIAYKTREIVSWEWDFDNDGTIDSNDQNPLHTYTEEGIYTVKLTVSDGTFNNTETKVDYIAVGDPIMADFEAEPLEGLQPLEVQFTDLSTGGLPGLLGGPTKKGSLKNVQKENSRDIVSWEWDFQNDGLIDSYIQNPIHTYIEEGLYTVSLTVSDGTNDDTEIKVDYITVTPVSGDIGLLPINTQLYSNHPNPFNPLTTISFDIKENETGTLTLFNIKGQIIESHQFESGKYNYIWDASKQASGIYFYKLQSQTTNETRKMLLLK